MQIKYYIYQNQIKRLGGLKFDKKGTKSNAQMAAELARKIVSGNAAAENEFVQLNHRWLLFIVRRQFSGSGHHEDILQDAFMLVLTKLKQGQINNPDAILAYLRTTAINIGFEYVKKDKKFTSAIDQNFIDLIEDSHDTVLTKMIWDDKVMYVKQVIQELHTQRDKDILMSFYFNSLEKASICQELDLTSEHFDRVIYRAKQRLKQLISDTDSNNINDDDSKNTRDNDSEKGMNKQINKKIKNILQSCIIKVFKLNWGNA